MSHSASLMPDSSPSEQFPNVLELLPDVQVNHQRCSPRIQQQIDLLLLAIEALELGGSEYMLAIAKQLQLQNIIKNRVVLWRLRCSNPWRRSYTRESLSLEQTKALVIITTYMSKRLTVVIRQLLIAEQQMREKNLPLENNFRLSAYLERFRTHFLSRMNPRRAKVMVYRNSPEELNKLAILLLKQLLFCTGTKGMNRLWVSLFDGEVA